MKTWCVLAALPLVAACASTPPPSFVEHQMREAEGVEPVSIAAPDGSFTARIAARPIGAIEARDDLYHALFDIGGDQPMQCSFYREEIDLATSLRSLSLQMLDILGERVGKLDDKQIARVDAGVVAGNPYLAVDWRYAATVAGASVAGEIKHLLASKDGRSLYCTHAEVGYQETFQSVVAGLIESLEHVDESEPPPQYLEILVYKVQGQRVGIEQVALAFDDAGDARTVVYDAMLLPVGDGELIAQDSTDVQFTTAAGELINQIHYRYQNGEPEASLSLVPGAEVGLWKVEGQFRSKNIDALFAAPRLSSWLGGVLAFRRGLAADGEDARMALVEWVPDANPVGPVKAKALVLKKLDDGSYRARIEIEALRMDVVVDRQGLTRSGVMKVGPVEIVIERIYAKGEIPSP